MLDASDGPGFCTRGSESSPSHHLSPLDSSGCYRPRSRLPLVPPSQLVSPPFAREPVFSRRWAGDSDSSRMFSMKSCWGKDACGIWEAALVCRDCAGHEEPCLGTSCAVQPPAVGGGDGSGGYCCTTEVRWISTARLGNRPDPPAEREPNCSRSTSGSSQSPRPRAGNHRPGRLGHLIALVKSSFHSSR